MDIVDQAIEELISGVPVEHRDNGAEIVRIARMKARITCRELGAVCGLRISQISDIEHGRLKVSDDVLTALFMVCGSKMVIKKEIPQSHFRNAIKKLYCHLFRKKEWL